MLLLATDVRAGVPCPQISLRNFEGPREVSLLGGEQPLPDGLAPNVYVEVFDGEASGLSDYMVGIGVAVVSTRLRAVLEGANAPVELISVPLQYKGKTRAGYSVLRARRVVRGIDMAASKAELIEVGVALSVERLVLDDKAFLGAQLALVYELAQLAVSDDLARSIEAAGCIGCAFVSPSDYRL